MKTLLFKIVQRQKMPVFLTLPEIKQFPTHEMYFNELSEKIIAVTYKPTSTFNKEKFAQFMCEKIKKRYRAYSVEVINPILSLEVAKDIEVITENL